MMFPRRLPSRIFMKLLTLGFLILILCSIVKIYWSISEEFPGYRTQSISDYAFITQNFSQSHSRGSRGNYSIREAEELSSVFVMRYNSRRELMVVADEAYSVFLERLTSFRPKGGMLVRDIVSPGNNSLERFHRGIQQHFMYGHDGGLALDALLADLKTQPIVSAEGLPRGSQIKVTLTFVDGTQAIFKPMRTHTKEDQSSDLFFYEIYERYYSEIAAFHLDRVFGLNRAVPTVGRALNITRELVPFLWDKQFVESVYTSPGGNICLIVKCLQKCGKNFPLCGNRDVLYGAVSANLPPNQIYRRSLGGYPYAHSYFKEIKSPWQLDEQFCETQVKGNFSLYTLLQFVDLAIFDFLIGNMDRHAYERFRDLDADSFVPIFDNARGFGESKVDYISCLAPLTQCCQIRLSTLVKLIKLYQGPNSLSQVMRTSLNSDPLSPVLPEPHLDSLDRRLGKVIKAVSDCIQNGRSWEDVVIDEMSSISL